jgi:hypothetical protein
MKSDEYTIHAMNVPGPKKDEATGRRKNHNILINTQTNIDTQ